MSRWFTFCLTAMFTGVITYLRIFDDLDNPARAMSSASLAAMSGLVVALFFVSPSDD